MLSMVYYVFQFFGSALRPPNLLRICKYHVPCIGFSNPPSEIDHTTRFWELQLNQFFYLIYRSDYANYRANSLLTKSLVYVYLALIILI